MSDEKLTELDRLMTVEEVAEHLAVAENTVRRWLKAGKLKGVKLNDRSWRVKPEDLKAWLDDKTSDMNT